MTLRWERWLPLGAATLCATSWWYVQPEPPVPQVLPDFLAASISLGAILTGFIATSQAILMALPSSSVMGRIQTSTYVDDLISYLMQALAGCIGFTVVSLMGFFKAGHFADSWWWFGIAWVWLGVFAAFSFARIVGILLALMKHPIPAGPRPIEHSPENGTPRAIERRRTGT